MPVNAPAEYFKAEERFKSAKSREERIIALEEMIRLLPRHHGSEQMLAQLKSRLAKLKKETESRKGARKAGIAKEGEAQICLIGFTQSGKSTLLSRLTDAKPVINSHPYTTTKPEIGMMDYRGIKVQLVEIPSTFLQEFISIARTADAIMLLVRNDNEKSGLEKILKDSFIHTKHFFANPWKEETNAIKDKIWHSLGKIIVYTKKTATPMALPRGSTIRDFAGRIHKDFVRNFRFARVLRRGRMIQAGLNYALEDGDVVELHINL